jgi:uncharacterized phiE125 gp8 family phage protein
MGAPAAVEPAVSISEAQAYVRIETGEEEAVLAGLLRTATAIGESFMNQVIVERDFVVDLPASTQWQQVAVSPVRSISSVEAVDTSGVASPLPSSAFAVDVDASGAGWVRLTASLGTSRIRVSGRVGMAVDQNAVPEPIRQGVLRLVAHLFAARDGRGEAPPAAVTALWRPYRRMQLA